MMQIAARQSIGTIDESGQHGQRRHANPCLGRAEQAGFGNARCGGQAVTFLFGPDGSRIAKLSSFTPLSVCFAIACPARRRINGLGEMGQQPFYERVNLQGGNGVARL